MNNENIRANLVNDIYARIMRSPTHGVGVYAIRKIPLGTDPFRKPDHCQSSYIEMKRDVLDVLEDSIQRYFKDMIVLRNDHYLYPDHGLNGLDISWFVNHSENPNLAVSGEDIDFVAIRPYPSVI